MRLGIDLGTTRTVVACVSDGRYPIATFETPFGFADYVPATAVLSESGWRYGWEALSNLGRAEAAINSVKRSVSGLAPDDDVPGFATGGPTALELYAAYLAELRVALLERSNLEIDPLEPLEATIAVPANASTRQRYLTLEAFRQAGFEVLGMLNEPTAAAIEYAHRNLSTLAKRSPKRYVVVYDLGGGTFDTSVVSLSGKRFDLLASEGIVQLGGSDFDAVILELALEAAGVDSNSVSSVARADLLEVCRQAKEALGPTSRRLVVDLGSRLPGQDVIALDTALVFQQTQAFVDRTVELVDLVFTRLGDSGIDVDNPRELGALYLVGGGSHFPSVSRALRARYKRKVQLAPQPQAATAIGLAIAADPEAGIFVRESVTRHFGVWREAERGREKVFDPLIVKHAAPNETGPLVVQRHYRPVHPIGHLRYIECSSLTASGQPAGDLTPWGDVLFPYDPALANRGELAGVVLDRRRELEQEAIVETYRYASDGRITVDIENVTRGYSRSYVLGGPARSSPRGKSA